MIKNYIDEKKFFLIIFLVSIFSLLSAIYIEYVLKVYPCKLCIYQRIPFILSVFVCFFLPIAIQAKPVKGISDFDGAFKGVERIDFECPPSDEKKIYKSNDDLRVWRLIYEYCL